MIKIMVAIAAARNYEKYWTKLWLKIHTPAYRVIDAFPEESFLDVPVKSCSDPALAGSEHDMNFNGVISGIIQAADKA
jgi:hypothetical protein